MRRRTTANNDGGHLGKNQEKLVTALQTLFKLLEEYAPGWYTQEHHDLASEALRSVSASGSTPLSRPRSKGRTAA